MHTHTNCTSSLVQEGATYAHMHKLYQLTGARGGNIRTHAQTVPARWCRRGKREM